MINPAERVSLLSGFVIQINGGACSVARREGISLASDIDLESVQDEVVYRV